jgi:hypothetical protein
MAYCTSFFKVILSVTGLTWFSSVRFHFFLSAHGFDYTSKTSFFQELFFCNPHQLYFASVFYKIIAM